MLGDWRYSKTVNIPATTDDMYLAYNIQQVVPVSRIKARDEITDIMDVDNKSWIMVPLSSLDELELKIKTVKNNLERKQDVLIQVLKQK